MIALKKIGGRTGPKDSSRHIQVTECQNILGKIAVSISEGSSFDSGRRYRNVSAIRSSNALTEIFVV
jgi:hypothetical protein